MPLSPSTSVSLGWSRQTPERITEAQISSIWSGATTVHEPVDAGFETTPLTSYPTVVAPPVKGNDEAGVCRGRPQGLPHHVPHGHGGAPRNEDGATQAELRAVTRLVGGGLRVVVRQAAEPEEAAGLGSVEVGDVVV